MTTEQYLTTFEKHLRVGEPKRAAIIGELTTHLQEIEDAEAVHELGDPKKLAQQYNRTHLGFFHHTRRLLLIPFIAWVVFMFVHYLAFDSFLAQFLPLIAVGGIAILLADSLARMKWTWGHFIVIIAFVFIMTTTFSFLTLFASRHVTYSAHNYTLDAATQTYVNNYDDTHSLPQEYVDQELNVDNILVDAGLIGLFITLGFLVFGFIATLVTKVRVIQQQPHINITHGP